MLEACAEQQGLPLRLCSRQRSKGHLCGAAHCNIFQKFQELLPLECLGQCMKRCGPAPAVYMCRQEIYMLSSHMQSTALD